MCKLIKNYEIILAKIYKYLKINTDLGWHKICRFSFRNKWMYYYLIFLVDHLAVRRNDSRMTRRLRKRSAHSGEAIQPGPVDRGRDSTGHAEGIAGGHSNGSTSQRPAKSNTAFAVSAVWFTAMSDHGKPHWDRVEIASHPISPSASSHTVQKRIGSGYNRALVNTNLLPKDHRLFAPGRLRLSCIRTCWSATIRT